MTMLKIIFMIFLLIQTSAFSSEIGLNFSFYNNNDTLYGDITLENFQNYPDRIYSTEITFEFDPTVILLDTIIFDSSIFEQWSNLYSIDNETGICIVVGSGVTAIETQGRMVSLTFSVLDTNIFVNPEDYITLTQFVLNEDVLYPIPTDIIEQLNNLPQDFTLKQNYPNPFNPTTTIEFSLNRKTDVKLSIYNMMGQSVKTLQQGKLAAGTYSYIWDGRNQLNQKIASGTYLYQLQTDERVLVNKMILLK